MLESTPSRKLYRYRFDRGPILSPLLSLFAVHLPGTVDLAAMERAAEHLLGEHDFTAFTLAGGSHTQPVRRIDEAVWQVGEGDRLDFRIVGNGFLRGMVRSIVGTLVEVGRRSAWQRQRARPSRRTPSIRGRPDRPGTGLDAGAGQLSTGMAATP